MKKLLVKQRIWKFNVLRFSLFRSSEFSSPNATCLSCHKSCGECYGPGSNHCLTCLPNHSLASGRHHIWFIIFIIRFSFKTRIIELTTIPGSCLSTCPPGQHKVCELSLGKPLYCQFFFYGNPLSLFCLLLPLIPILTSSLTSSYPRWQDQPPAQTATPPVPHVQDPVCPIFGKLKINQARIHMFRTWYVLTSQQWTTN